MKFPDALRVGDQLLYNSLDIFDVVEDIASGDSKAHIELYIGTGLSVASRNAIGVNSYQFRLQGLVQVRRDLSLINIQGGLDWFATVKGAAYGYSDLLEAVDPSDGTKMIQAVPTVATSMDCSCFASWFLQMCGHPQFDTAYDHRKIRPEHFCLSPRSQIVWDAGY